MTDTAEAPTEDPTGEPTMSGSHWLRVGLMLLALVFLVHYTGWWGLAIVAGLVLMIFLHELGHFLMAKRAGMKVTEFFIGFGPRLWSFRRGETEYGVKLIPAGAYVRIVGMSMAEDLDEADEDRTYRAQPFWQRFGVAVAGSAMHFLQALVLIFVVLVGLGVPGGRMMLPTPGPQVTQIGDVYAHCPAAEAGLRPDDEIISINGQHLDSYKDLPAMIEPLAGKNATIVARRDGVDKTFVAHIVGGTGDRSSSGILGVNYGPKPTPVERVGVAKAVPQTFAEFGYTMWQTIPAFAHAFSPSSLKSYGNQVVNANKDRRAADNGTTPAPTTTVPATAVETPTRDSVSSKQCVRSMGGPPAFKGSGPDSAANQNRFLSIVGIFDIGRGMAQSGGVASLLGLFVIVNIFIGLFNLIPLLPFDGGHIAIAVYEKAQEWRRRLHHRYYCDVNKLLPLTSIVIVLLGLLFVSSLYLDFVNPPSVN